MVNSRRSTRLKEYDYSRPGAYFVTICTRDRECLLGDIADGEMFLSAAGEIAQSAWVGLPARYPSVTLDEYVIMPNHVHGIILVGAQFIAPDSKNGMSSRVYTLGEIIRAYKATVTRLVRTRDDALVINQGVIHHAPTGAVRFGWQRNYYEHVIRNDDDLQRTREYIVGNSARWDEDENNPAVIKSRQ